MGLSGIELETYMPTQGYDIDNDDHYIEVIGTNSADTIDG